MLLADPPQTDITGRKLHEESQRLRVVEAEQRRLAAEDAKMQQELLIDITSHEIRNPISSLMQISLLLSSPPIIPDAYLRVCTARAWSRPTCNHFKNSSRWS